MGSEREFPRPNGMMQKVQRWSHPFCTWTKARTRRSGPWIRCAAGSRTPAISLTLIFSSPTTVNTHSGAATSLAPPGAMRQLCTSSFSSLGTTMATSGIAAKDARSICAAQPVTTIRACGRARLIRRMVCRDCRTASAVTAQVFTTTVSVRPAASALRPMISDSQAFRRQPRVRTSIAIFIYCHIYSGEWASGAANSAGSKRASYSNSTGPVIST